MEESNEIVIGYQEWQEDIQGKNGWTGGGWFDDKNNSLGNYTIIEYLDFDKFGNPLKAKLENMTDECVVGQYIRNKAQHRIPWKAELAKIIRCPQRQDSLDDQLRDLTIIANKFGFYDAADYLRTILEK